MAIKWRKVKNNEEWFCDCCRKCSQKSCCGDQARSWFKRLWITTAQEQDALNRATWSNDCGPLSGAHLSDWEDEFALCDACWDRWSPRVERAMTKALLTGAND